MKRLLLYVVVIVLLVGASVKSILVDKRNTEVKQACEQVMPRRGEPSTSRPAPAPSALSLVQVNEEQQTCHLRKQDE